MWVDATRTIGMLGEMLADVRLVQQVQTQARLAYHVLIHSVHLHVHSHCSFTLFIYVLQTMELPRAHPHCSFTCSFTLLIYVLQTMVTLVSRAVINNMGKEDEHTM